MEFIKGVALGLLVGIILVLITLVVLRIVYQMKSKEKRLNDLDKKLNNDKYIKNAEIIVKNLNTNQLHHFTKNNNLNKLHYIASITKLFTDAVAFNLIDENLIQYEDQITKYLDESYLKGLLMIKKIDYTSFITISDLINQTSGLRDYETDYKQNGKDLLQRLSIEDFEISADQALALTKQLEGLYQPCQSNKAYYSNINAILLAMICEKVTNKSLFSLYQKYILTPLKLYSVKVPLTVDETYDIGIKSAFINPIKYITSAIAAGGLAMSMKDLMLFLENFMLGNLFNPSHLTRQEFKPVQFYPIQYGNGMMKIKMTSLMSPLFKAVEVIGHSGSSGSFAYYAPNEKLMIVGSINQISRNIYQYVFAYLDAIKMEQKTTS